MFTDDEHIKKKDIFDPIQDDDDIDWKYNPFDVDLIESLRSRMIRYRMMMTLIGSRVP